MVNSAYKKNNSVEVETRQKKLQDKYIKKITDEKLSYDVNQKC